MCADPEVLEDLVGKVSNLFKNKKKAQKSYQKNTWLEALNLCISLRCYSMPAGNNNFIISHFHASTWARLPHHVGIPRTGTVQSEMGC